MTSERSGLVAWPIYNSTYTLYRLSPLHFRDDAPQSPAGLRSHTRRLQDALTGDTLRGIGADLDQGDGLARAGALQRCPWAWIEGSGIDAGVDSPRSIDGLGVCEGIQVDIEYEKTSYRALMLRPQSLSAGDHPKELHLPLLLLRMPATLRQFFLEYISTSFDARPEPMLVPGLDLATLLERYLAAVGSGGAESIQSIVQQVQLSLTFRAPTLRSMDITISPEDVPLFIRRGKTAPEASATRHGPFFISLADYLAQHMAVDIHHEDLSLSRVACGAFALGSEGKAKIFAPAARGPSAEATTALLKELLSRAGDQTLSEG